MLNYHIRVEYFCEQIKPHAMFPLVRAVLCKCVCVSLVSACMCICVF